MVTNGLMDDFRVIAANLLKPHSTAKWMIKNRNVRLTVALHSIPFLTLLVVLSFSPLRNSFGPLFVSALLGAVVTNVYMAIISLIVSATSGKVLGVHLDFAYVFCAFGSAMLVIAPVMIVALPVAFLSLFDWSLIFLYWLLISPVMPCSIVQVVLSFTLFGINKNRLITGLAIYMIAQALIVGLISLAAINAITSMFTSMVYGSLLGW